jgi:hypothetical protein
LEAEVKAGSANCCVANGKSCTRANCARERFARPKAAVASKFGVMLYHFGLRRVIEMSVFCP